MKSPTKPKRPPLVKICKRCGDESPHSWDNTNNRYRHICKSCHNNYNRDYRKTPKYKQTKVKYQSRRNREFKRFLVDLLGGKCQRCGLQSECDAIYDFHHPDPSKKEFTISQIRQTTKRVIKEAQKCELLCANCHRREHWAKTQA